MMALWVKLSGKKTTIGAGLLLAALVIGRMVAIWCGVDADGVSTAPDWVPRLIETLEYFGGALSGVGLAHKGAKAVVTARLPG